MLSVGLHGPWGPAWTVTETWKPTVVSGVRPAIAVFPVGVEGMAKTRGRDRPCPAS